MIISMGRRTVHTLLILGLLLCVHQVRGQQPSDTLYVKSIVMTTDIENHEPADTVYAFASTIDDRAYCHVRIFNGTGERTIRFRWLRNGNQYYTRPLTISNSTGFRAYTSVDTAPGKWEVRILDEDGTVLARKRFSILRSTVQSDN